MKKSFCCCHNPALALGLVRVGVVILFLIPGIMKLMDPTMFQGMLTELFGAKGGMILFLYWLVVAFEILGSLFVFLGKLVPLKLYKISLLGLLIISLIALFLVHIPTKNIMPILFQVLTTLCLMGLFVTKPLCCCGILGYKGGESCSTK
jgi:uncharacterized membrane protein YphA (DoxX/SURF4 family)